MNFYEDLVFVTVTQSTPALFFEPGMRQAISVALSGVADEGEKTGSRSSSFRRSREANVFQRVKSPDKEMAAMMILGFFQLRNCFCFSGIQISFKRGRIRIKMHEWMGIQMIHGNQIYASHAGCDRKCNRRGKRYEDFRPGPFVSIQTSKNLSTGKVETS